MSSEKTPNLGLHKWAPKDYVQMGEFNENFGKLDEKTAEVTTQLAEKAKIADIERIKKEKQNLIRNSDFEQMPFVSSRSSVYSFATGIVSPSHDDKKSFKVESIDYETSPDNNKDFAFILTEQLLSSDKIKVSFWVYPMVSGKSLGVRMAYSTGVSVPLGQPNQWNKIDIELDLTGMTVNNGWLYFDFKSSYTLYLSEIVAERNNPPTDVISTSSPISFTDVNEKLKNYPDFIQNSQGMIERMIQVGQTYLDNISQFVYGNTYTAYDKTVQTVEGKYQIDCSSFANLVLHGVPFEKSRYNGNMDNANSPLFFDKLDGYKIRYAHQMGKYAVDKGYGFVPNSDFSNLEPGDVLFFSWDAWNNNGDMTQADRNNAFMKIDHVGIFLNKNDSSFFMLQLDNGFSTVFYTAPQNYINQCVLAARFPFPNINRLYPEENLVVDGDVSKSSNGSFDAGLYSLTKPLTKKRYYTLFIDGKVDTDNCYFLIQYNNKTIYSDFGRKNKFSGLFECPFPFLLDDVSSQIKISIGSSTGESVRNATVNWCALYEGFLRNKKVYTPNSKFGTINPFVIANQALVDDLDANMNPDFRYKIEGNEIRINLNLPLKTLRTGALVIGNLPANTVAATRKMPINLIGATNATAINAVLQITASGTVTIIPFDNAAQWRYAMVSGFVFK